MNTLYIEVVGSVVLAGLLGLGTGWMMQRARAARRLRRTVAFWKQRCDELMPSDDGDARSLQEQVHSLDQLLGVETARTRELETQLGAAGTRLEKARGDAIRLNSQQAGIQERLQRIIREKDRELGELAQRASRSAAQAPVESSSAERIDAVAQAVRTTPAARSVPGVAAAGAEIEAYIDRLSDRGERTRHDAPPVAPTTAPLDPRPARAQEAAPPTRSVDLQDHRTVLPGENTVAPVTVSGSPRTVPPPAGSPIDPAASLFDDGFEDDLDDTLDATAIIDMEFEHEVHAARRSDPPEDPLDATSQEPLLYDEDTIAFDEDTIAFDEATLARVRERSHSA